MAGVRARAGTGAILLALVVLGPVLAPPLVRAADETAQVLPGQVDAAVVVDIDGDGAQDLVRIMNAGGILRRVEAWGYDGARWSLLGSVPLPVDEDVPLRADIFTLLVQRVEGRERVLILTARSEVVAGSPPGNPCCLSMFGLQTNGDDIALQPLSHDGASGQTVQVLDVDADGTDELVVFGVVDAGINGLEMLRWSGTGFERAFAMTDPFVGYGVWTGDSDGVAGDDLLFGPTPEGDLQRVAWIEGEMRAERGHLDLGERFGGWIPGIADGNVVLQTETDVRVVRWPRGDVPQLVSRLSSVVSASIWVVGADADALVVRQDYVGSDDPPPTTVYDLELRQLGEVRASAVAARLWSLAQRSYYGSSGPSRGVYPFVGSVWGTTGDGRPSFVANGAMIQPGGEDGYEVQAMASLPGLQPVGTAGPDGGWMALILSYVSPPTTAYLYPGAPALGRISLAPMADLLRPDGGDARPALELRNAVEQGDAVDGVRPLLAGGNGFTVVVDAPAGSYVFVVNGLIPVPHGYDVSAEPLVAEFTPRPRSAKDENQPLEATLILITPDGRASTVSWSGTYLRELPELTVAGQTDSMALSATLSGRTSEGASVSVDGRLIATDATGRFLTTVDAPIWPSQVLVVARDPFGHETVTRLEVVGVLDYRGFPWAALVVAATIAVGAALFVRTPRRRPADARMRSGDGRLEELELEDLEELARAGIRRR